MMIDRLRTSSGALPRLAPLVLVLGIAAATWIWPAENADGLSTANPDRSAASQVDEAFDTLPSGALVLVAMDADLGTYPEIRGAVRAAIDDLLARGVRLAFVSYSPEGRAIAAAELDRRGDSAALLDLGFVAGAEAALVRSVTDILPAGANGEIAGAIRSGGSGIGAFDMALLVGGSDIGPRSWVEQVGTRLPTLPMVAIVPTFAQPEIGPYLRSGQLTAVLATARDDAAFVEGTRSGGSLRAAEVPSSVAMLIGAVVALAAIAVALAGSIGPAGAASGADAVESDEAER